MREELLVASKIECMRKTKGIVCFQKPWIISLVVVGKVAYVFSNSVPSDVFFVFELLGETEYSHAIIV